MKRVVMAAVVIAIVAFTALPASASTVYRSPELRITESITGGATTWTFRNRTNHAERVTCRWGITVILSDGDTVQDHIHWTTSLDANGHRERFLRYGDGVVSIRSSEWRCTVRP